MSIKIKNLVEKLKEKDQDVEVEFIVIESTGKNNLVCMDVKNTTKGLIKLLKLFK